MIAALRRFRLTPRRRDLLIIAACLIGQGIYLVSAGVGARHHGYPLDDAWIYQTYARNLAQTGQWAFVPGIPSTGSTSILWTVLVAPGHMIPIDPYWWTQFLGLGMLIGTSLGTARWFDADDLRGSLAVGLATALEWHLVWAAASGMETLLFTGLMVWFWLWFRRQKFADTCHSCKGGLLLGVWGGILMLARPEGVVAFAIAGLYGIVVSGRWSRKLIRAAAAGLGFSLFLIPFFGLNYLVAGQIWPNTFYAKQTEYQVLWQIPYWQRLLEQLALPFIGAQLLLLPGLFYTIIRSIRSRIFAEFLPLFWVLAHLGLYAARLPVTYQHGRYVIPVIPILILIGLEGTRLLLRPRSLRPAIRLASLTWMLATVVMFPAMLIFPGASAFRNDVAFIGDEMVATAEWVAANTDPQTMIAAHDIGALGYFAPRPILDLAGLISPAVIPAMHDPNLLTAFILQSDAEYLVAFSRWSESYNLMLSSPHFCAVWMASEQEAYTARSGLGPMTVYRISREGECSGLREAADLHGSSN